MKPKPRERNRKTVGKLTINHRKITRTGHADQNCACLVNFEHWPMALADGIGRQSPRSSPMVL